jgi:uncharacterized protein (TIGR03089 family)
MGRFAENAGGPPPDTVAGLFARAVAVDPARPLLTYYDDATGERTELSGATLDNWVAKTANLLVDGCGLGPGDRAAVLLPPHWQAAAVLLGCWTAGVAVGSGPGPVEVVFAAVPRVGAAPDAPDRFALGLAPMALPLREVPPGFLDYVAEVRGHGDRYGGPPLGPAVPALDGRTQADLCAAARDRAAALGLGPDDRVLVDAAAHPDPLDWLLAPLAAGATIVLCGQLAASTRAARIEAERVTRTLG